NLVEWTPYVEPRTQRIIPAWVHDSQASWNAVCPLLCFPIVEWHQVDRVMRQLGGLQHIPTAPLIMDDMHVHDGRFGRGSGIRRIYRVGTRCGMMGYKLRCQYILVMICVHHTSIYAVFPPDLPLGHTPDALQLRQPTEADL
ncbi:hypothetical protein PIB30_104910, partial [Stylosanthes scabra]|nr:hypothetical protein [Stylosanthes scabra]